jgi:hypothetical protein
MLHNPVSQVVSQCLFSLILADFFLRLFNRLQGGFVVPSRRVRQLNQMVKRTLPLLQE